MNTHKELVQKYEVHKKLENVISELQKEVESNKYQLDVIDEFKREILILNIVKEVFSNVDDQLLSLDKLDNVRSLLNQLNSSFQQYRITRNETYINNMMKFADQIFSSVGGYKISDQLQYQIVSEYIKSINDELKKFREDIQSNQLKLSSLNNEINRLDNMVETIKSDIENSQQSTKKENESRLALLDKNINDFKIRMEAEADRLKQRNGDMVQKSIESAKENMDIKNNELKELLNRVKASADKLQQETEDQLDAYLKTVQTIIGRVNTTMFSYKYQQVADDAKKRTFLWNIFFFISLGISAFFAYGTIEYVINFTAESNFIYGAVSRSVMIMILLAAVGYCGKQAAEQGKVERYARKIEMELVAFDTFVESLPDDIKQGLKSEVVKRIFINRENIIEDSVAETGGIINALKDIAAKLSHLAGPKN